jgi:hypothetical protein
LKRPRCSCLTLYTCDVSEIPLRLPRQPPWRAQTLPPGTGFWTGDRHRTALYSNGPVSHTHTERGAVSAISAFPWSGKYHCLGKAFDMLKKASGWQECLSQHLSAPSNTFPTYQRHSSLQPHYLISITDSFPSLLARSYIACPFVYFPCTIITQKYADCSLVIVSDSTLCLGLFRLMYYRHTSSFES